MVWHDLRIHHKPRPDHWTVFLDSPRYAPTRTISRYRTTARALGAARSHPARDRPDFVARFRAGQARDGSSGAKRSIYAASSHAIIYFRSIQCTPTISAYDARPHLAADGFNLEPAPPVHICSRCRRTKAIRTDVPDQRRTRAAR